MAKAIKRIFPKVDFTQLIKEKQSGLYESSDFYRPISIAIQGNNYCSLGSCAGCGISSTNDINAAESLPKKKILELLQQASEAGIFLYYTNFTGEITDDLGFFAEILMNNPDMDAHKLNTNCSKFNSLDEAIEIFKVFKEIGWTRTNYVVPTCVLSAGMQEHAVPLENVAHGIEAFGRVFGEDEANLLISHYYTNHLFRDTFERLQRVYVELYGKKISREILKSDPVSNFGRARNFGESHFEMKPLKE